MSSTLQKQVAATQQLVERIGRDRREFDIVVGTGNPVKIKAVRQAVRQFSDLVDLPVHGVEVGSSVSAQPQTMRETLSGAYTRAYLAWKATFGRGMGIGIEGGLFRDRADMRNRSLPDTSQFDVTINITACVVVTAEVKWPGLSTGFEHPPAVSKLLDDNRGMTVDEAYRQAGLTKLKLLGHSQGAIGILTDGRTNRQRYIQEAVVRALQPLHHPELF